ncbi:hypothetical protein GSI_05856 [Ganoderma sinense ZZ0214-1]|uniref:DUF6534 domain-containing protein n=1 Tax=Ganoderma sinense ZZ0214-1 TaxID=1077348 RepID=A0A2G8SBM0_9APHY|nr:hypothetical protein GSI_05856 [Ganoderma sinense ZZ0214-1]
MFMPMPMFGAVTAVVTDRATVAEVAMTNSMGAWLIGCSVTILLNGFMFHQAYQYFREYENDMKFMKIWVLIVLVFETLLSILMLHTSYFYLVQMYWDPTYFFTQKPVWSLCLLPIPGALAALISQVFFVRRLWMLTPKFRVIVAIAFCLLTGNLGSFTALSINMFKAKSFADGAQWAWLATLGCGTQMIGDIILTMTLIHVLHQSRTGMNRTDSMLEIMIAYAISTGALGCILHLINVILSLTIKNVFIYGAILVILVKLYANTFLVALNTRKFLLASSTISSSAQQHMSSSMRAHFHSTAQTSQATAIELKVVTEESVDYDPEDGHRRADSEKSSAV